MLLTEISNDSVLATTYIRYDIILREGEPKFQLNARQKFNNKDQKEF